jgi:hypothetical protein
MAQIQAEDSWVVVGSGGHYADACVRFGLAKPGQHLVVKFSQWNKWYNEQRWARVWIKPPTPAFCGETWEVANQIRDDLNNWKE